MTREEIHRLKEKREAKEQQERVEKARKHIRSAFLETRKRNKKTNEAKKRQLLLNKALEARAYARAIDAERDAEFTAN